MASAGSSHVRVFVTFKEDAVFAGEHVEATITFRNVHTEPRPQTSTNISSRNPPAPASRRPSTTSFLPSRPTHSRQPSLASQTTKGAEPSPRKSSFGHRQAHSLNILENGTAEKKTASRSSAAKSATHSRSVSILSFGSDTDKPKKGRPTSMQRDPGRPGLKLTRSASVQVTSASPRPAWQGSPSLNSRPFPSPLATTVTPPPDTATDFSPVVNTPDSATFTNGRMSKSGHQRAALGKGSLPSNFPPSSFKFPASPDVSADTPEAGARKSPSPNGRQTPTRPHLNQSVSEPPVTLEPRARGSERRFANTVGRVLSLSSDAGTPRSSMDQTDVYSSSNHSDDTATSESVRGPISRLLGKPVFFRQPSQLGSTPRQRPPETLMMGFAQLYGSFTVDGSLVNQGPFEEVKRRAVVGGQGGGGVVGVERPKNDSKLFGGFSWGNIGESLGGILGGNEPSSIREMKGKAQAKSIPLLSTPKSILFVDLKLAPGESKSFSYRIPLPRGLPPSHRGRAMKIAYQLVIGTQRVGSGRAAREQQIKHVEVPFRLFGGVDSRGEMYNHDLMDPYILLKDQAQTAPVNDQGPMTLGDKQRATKPPTQSSEADFNAYIQALLKSPHRGSTASNMSTLHEPVTPSVSHGSAFSQSLQIPGLDTRTLIDNAIRTSMQPNIHNVDERQAATSRTNFTIARSGQPIATLILSRPALRLGDLLHVTLDFGAAAAALSANQTPTLVHGLTLTLESSETVESMLAIRSATSVERVTRRVWDRRVVGGTNASALAWCKRWSGSLKIPASATPAFLTSGVGCAWCVRVEIGAGVGMRAQTGLGLDAPDDEDDEGSAQDDNDSAKHETNERSDLEQDASEKTATSRPIKSPGRGAASKRKTRSDMLLEGIGEDERGATDAAVRQIACETFEIAVPIRVFGAVGATDTAVAKEAQDMEGLSI